jgi:hypothetical protein
MMRPHIASSCLKPRSARAVLRVLQRRKHVQPAETRTSLSVWLTAVASVHGNAATLRLRAFCSSIEAAFPSGNSASCSYYDQGLLYASASVTIADYAHIPTSVSALNFSSHTSNRSEVGIRRLRFSC